MSKTIKELAKKYANYMCPVEYYYGGVYNKQRNRDMSIYIDNAKPVLEWLFSEPLISRLTNVERKNVLKIHERYANEITKYDDEVIKANANGVMHAIELIFGIDIFKEG